MYKLARQRIFGNSEETPSGEYSCEGLEESKLKS